MPEESNERPYWWRANALAAADYVIGILLLGGLASMGLAAWDVVQNVALIAVTVNLVFWGCFRAGLTSGLRDPLVGGLQVMAGCGINLVGIILAPQLFFFFVINLFVPLSFGRFHFPRRTFIGAWILICVSLGSVMALMADQIHVELGDNRSRVVFWFICSLAFGRFLVIHSEVSRMRAKLRESNNRLSASRDYIAQILSELPVPLMVFDTNGALVLANKACAREMRDFEKPGPPPQLVDLLLQLRPVASGNARGPLLRNQEMEGSDGRRFLMDASVLPDSKHDATDGETVVSLWNITPLRQAEKQRETALNFLSHDLRAPLSALLASLNDPDMDLRQSRARIHASVRGCLSLVDDFVLIARTTRTDPAQLRGLDLHEVVSDAVSGMEPLAKERGVELSMDPMEGGAPVSGDWSLLRRAIVNLLDNAVRHSPENGKVRVALLDQGDQWTLVVDDEGPGFRSLAGHEPKGGDVGLASPENAMGTAGLGLKLVSLVAGLHAGSFMFGNLQETGARVKLSLPKASQNPVVEASA